MPTADQLAIVNKLLLDSEQAHTIATASLVTSDWTRTKVVLVLVRSDLTREEAVLVICRSSIPVTRVQDLSISTAVPIDTSFR